MFVSGLLFYHLYARTVCTQLLFFFMNLLHMLQVHTVLVLLGCNHVTTMLYCLEEYVYLGLYEDELKGCADRLQMWNRPRKRNVVPQPTDEVTV